MACRVNYTVFPKLRSRGIRITRESALKYLGKKKLDSLVREACRRGLAAGVGGKYTFLVTRGRGMGLFGKKGK